MGKKKDDGIELSPKYGVNPTMPLCFFCGEHKGEIALLGRIYERDSRGRKIRNSDIQAPREVCLDYEPCDKCREGMLKENIALVEVTEADNSKYPEIVEGYSPTGRLRIVEEKAMKEMLNDEDILNGVHERRVALMIDSDYKLLFDRDLEDEE